MSVSRPTIGTAVVEATRYAVVTHVNRSKPSQVGDDTRHRGRHDGLIERREEHGQQNADHRQNDLTLWKLDEVLRYRLVGHAVCPRA